MACSWKEVSSETESRGLLQIKRNNSSHFCMSLLISVNLVPVKNQVAKEHCKGLYGLSKILTT